MDELKALFGQAFISQWEETTDLPSFYWFRDEFDRTFGIRKSGITDKELGLLKLHYSLTNPPNRTLSSGQQAWMELLLEGTTQLKLDVNEGLTQLLFIQFKSTITDVEEFEEAILGYFPGKVTLLWLEAQLAVLIASLPPVELPNGEEIMEQINTDFLVSAKIYIGTPFHHLELAPTIYKNEKAAFYWVQKAHPDRYVFHYTEAIPLLLKESDLLNLEPFFHTLDIYLKEDPDCREQLEALFEHNLNLSTTAKALFMHRNSLSYRIDKLKEATGLDPRIFRDAFYIQLGLYRMDL